jgi:hypothetical protein
MRVTLHNGPDSADRLGPYDAVTVEPGLGGTGGYLLPWFTPDTMRQFVADLAAYPDSPFDSATLDGDTVHIWGDSGCTELVEAVRPRNDGTYGLGHNYWWWQLADEQPQELAPRTVGTVIRAALTNNAVAYYEDDLINIPLHGDPVAYPVGSEVDDLDRGPEISLSNPDGDALHGPADQYGGMSAVYYPHGRMVDVGDVAVFASRHTDPGAAALESDLRELLAIIADRLH